MYYSKSKKGFYPDDMRMAYDLVGSWPYDALPVTPEQEMAIRLALSQNKTTTYVNGEWQFADYVPTKAERESAANALKIAAQALANTQISILTDATDSGIVIEPTAQDIALLIEWKKYRQAIRLVDIKSTSIVWPAHPELAN